MAKSKLVTEAHLKEALEPYATKKDLDRGLESLENRIDARLEENVKLMMGFAERAHQDTLNCFHDYVDHIHGKLQGANEDHLGLHDDKLDDHEERIAVLETA